MTLLQDLVDGAAGNTTPVATLLRQLKVIAARADTQPLDTWVSHELAGYQEARQVPAYRGPFEYPVLGHFFGAFGSQVRNVLIPPVTFPPDLRDGVLFRVWLTQSVAELEKLAAAEQTGMPWPADAVAYYNHGIQDGTIQPVVRPGMVLAAADRPLSSSVFASALDGVRTRVLDLALELEKVAPDIGQPDAAADTRAQAAQVISNHFHGPVTNVAIGSTNVAQTVTVHLPAPGDETMLLRYLGAHGVDPSRLVALREALEHDRADAGGQHPPTAGARVKAWMGHALTDVGTNAAGGVIGAAIAAFFGG